MGRTLAGSGSDERGGVVVLVLLLGGLISAVGLGLVLLSSTERVVAGNFQAGARTLYAAEAVAEHVILDLVTDRQWTDAVSGTRRSSFIDGTTHPLAPWGETLDLPAMTAALQLGTDAASPWGADTPRWRLFASGTLATLGGAGREPPTYLVAWVADDPSDHDGDPAIDTNGVIVIRAQAQGIGGMRRSVQVVLRRFDPDNSDADAGTPPEEPAEVTGSSDLARIMPLDTTGEVSGSTEVRVLSWREVR